MSGGICFLSLVAVRSAPSDTAEMVNQLLFGDLVDIAGSQGSWLHVVSRHDGYEGWCDFKQITLLDEELPEQLSQSSRMVVTSPTATLSSDVLPSITIVRGSTLYRLSGEMFAGPGGNYHLSAGDAAEPLPGAGRLIADTASEYLKSPYLWGGRSPFGIDCSGLVQVVFARYGIRLPRDAWQQSAHGQLINLIEEIEPGDVAYFDNEEGRIIHTGILTGQGTVIHGSGEVRTDPIDHHGVFNRSQGKYTHKLRLIKRMTTG